MRPLYDHQGHVRVWLNDDEKWLLELHGEAVAYIFQDSVYDLKGRHLAWWTGDRVLDHSGNVILIVPDAQDLRVSRPPWHPRPTTPIERTLPAPPMLGLKPSLSFETGRWTDASVTIDSLRSSANLHKRLTFGFVGAFP